MLALAVGFVSQKGMWTPCLDERKNEGDGEELWKFQLGQVFQYSLGIICSHAAEGCPAGRTEPPLQTPGPSMSEEMNKQNVDHQGRYEKKFPLL